ncbi:MAG: hypothetical protein OSB66_09540 [SAR202 cluster bacterium]|nr:hypothetical protein [SAR202 cluster bacterium]
MRLTKHKRHRKKLAKRYVRSRELTDTKPLKKGGRFHVHHGRVHKGAGFEGHLFGAVSDVMDLLGGLGDKTRAALV